MIFNAIFLHKKSIRVTWRLQTFFYATFVAATCSTTLNRFQFLTTLLQLIDCHDTRIDVSRNNVAFKIAHVYHHLNIQMFFKACVLLNEIVSPVLDNIHYLLLSFNSIISNVSLFISVMLIRLI